MLALKKDTCTKQLEVCLTCVVVVQAIPAAHRGFLMRARAVSIETLYEHACRQKKRLVLSGMCSTLQNLIARAWHDLHADNVEADRKMTQSR